MVGVDWPLKVLLHYTNIQEKLLVLIDVIVSKFIFSTKLIHAYIQCVFKGAQWLSGRHCGPSARHIYPSLVLVNPGRLVPV